MKKRFENSSPQLDDLEKELLQDFGNWELTEDGSIIYNGKAIGYKKISQEDLADIGLTHMLQKGWSGNEKDAKDFYFVYLEALRRAGYKEFTIDLNDIHKFDIK